MKKIHWIALSVILLGVVLDQALKAWALRSLVDNTWEILPFFSLYLTFNHGIAFSFPFPRFLLIVLTCIFLLGLGWWFLSRNHSSLERWGIVLLMSGGLGNLIDRVSHEAVIDFIRIGTFPVFNLADILISVGIGLLLLAQVWSSSAFKS